MQFFSLNVQHVSYFSRANNTNEEFQQSTSATAAEPTTSSSTPVVLPKKRTHTTRVYSVDSDEDSDEEPVLKNKKTDTSPKTKSLPTKEQKGGKRVLRERQNLRDQFQTTVVSKKNFKHTKINVVSYHTLVKN